MSLQQNNIEATQAVFGQFGAGNIDGILEHLDEEIVIEFYGPSSIPYAGTYRGKTEARRFFETVLSSVTINQFDPEEFLADSDKVIVTGHLNLNSQATGGEIDSDFVHVITLREGRWLRFRDFMNTAVAVGAFAGES